MRKMAVAALSAWICLGLVACNSAGSRTEEPPQDIMKDAPAIDGIMTDLDENSMLVEGLNRGDKGRITFTENTLYFKLAENQYQKGQKSDLNTGMKVKVWVSELMESYPFQGRATLIIYEEGK